MIASRAAAEMPSIHRAKVPLPGDNLVETASPSGGSRINERWRAPRRKLEEVHVRWAQDQGDAANRSCRSPLMISVVRGADARARGGHAALRGTFFERHAFCMALHRDGLRVRRSRRWVRLRHGLNHQGLKREPWRGRQAGLAAPAGLQLFELLPGRSSAR